MIPRPQELPRLWFQWPEARFGRFNFQRDETIDALAELLSSDRPPAVAVLGGERGIGRRFLCEAAVWRVREAGKDAAVWHLDLDGFEPEAEHSLRRYIEHLLEAQGREIETARTRRAGAAKAVAHTLLGSSFVGQATEWAATLVSLVTQLEEPVEQFAELLSAPARADGRPPRDDPETLRRFLTELTHERKLLVHLRDGTAVPSSLRRWLVREAERAPDRLLLVVSCGLEVPTDAVIPSGIVRHEPERFDLHPLDFQELRQLLDRRFAPNAFPGDLAGALLRASHGRPAEVAVRLAGLMEAEVLDEDDHGVWRLPEEGLANERAAGVFATILLKELDLRLEAEGGRERTLRRFLELAALCGTYVPATLLLENLQLAEDEADAVIDFLDDHLVDDLAWFVDLEFRHPSFPRWSVYVFTNPVLPQVLLDSLATIDREMLAIHLLRFLEGRAQADTRGMARLFLAIAEHLGEREREPYERQLAWWIGLEETEELQQEVREALEREELDPEVVWRVVNNSANHWPAARRLALLDAYAQAVVGKGGKAAGVISTDRLADFYLLRAALLWGVSRFSECLAEAVTSLEFSENNQLRRGQALNLCGLARKQLGLLRPAKDNLEEALRLFLETLGPVHSLTLMAQHNLAGVLRQQGELAEARALFESCLESQRHLLGAEHPDSLATQDYLAGVLHDQGELAEALAIFQRVLEARCRLLGPEHPDTLTTQDNLACVLHDQGELVQARAHFESVLETRRRLLGPEDPGTLATQNNLSGLLHDQGELTEARAILERALEGLRHRWGLEHRETLVAHQNLASILLHQGELASARALFESVLEVECRVLGREHPATLTAQHNLASVLQNQGELPEAQVLFESVLEARRRVLGLEHPDTVTTQAHLTAVLRAIEAANALAG